MVIHMNREQRNRITAEFTKRHLEIIEELVPSGLTVNHDVDHEITQCFGMAVAGRTQRIYEATIPRGVIKIQGPLQNNISDSQLRKHFAAELKRALVS
jgi:hypothetical protein